MYVSLRTMVLWTFALLVLSACIQGIVAIGTTVRSAQQVTSLDKNSLAPAVSLDIVSQNLDQERALVTLDFTHMSAAHVNAVDAELRSLDASIEATASQALESQALRRWRPLWKAFTAARIRYVAMVLHPVPGFHQESALTQLSDRLNAVLDLVQTEQGLHLYNGENLYLAAIESDWNAIRTTIAGFIVALVIGAMLAVLITGRLSRGLGNLLATARAITQGNLDVRADESGRDEIAVLAAAYNHMTDALLSAERRADSDPLTGLLNHRAFHGRLTDEIVRARANGDDLCVLMIDINNFKLFNDTYGHQVGDGVLMTFADLLRRECRPTDQIARYGGDEFVLLAPSTDLAAGRALAHNLLDAAAHTAIRVRDETSSLPLALCIGVACAPGEAETALTLMELADRRLFESKHNGGGVSGAEEETPVVRLSPNAPFSVLDGLVTAIDHKDRYTREHSEWVARFADVMAQGLAWPMDARQRLRMAALIHDVGKIGIPDHILRKPDRLSDEEYATMKQHVVLSELLVAQVLPAPDVVDAVRYHHERWDGKGYPHGVAGSDIPLAGRIMIIADASSAMYLDRPYRKGLPVQTLVAELQRHRGTQFDPELVDPFVAALLAPTSPLTAAAATQAGSSAA